MRLDPKESPARRDVFESLKRKAIEDMKRLDGASKNRLAEIWKRMKTTTPFAVAMFEPSGDIQIRIYQQSPTQLDRVQRSRYIVVKDRADFQQIDVLSVKI